MAEGPRGRTETIVVIVFVGLVAAAVAVSGAPLVEAVKGFMMRRDVESVRAMVLTYRSLYGTLPGDDVAAVERWRRRPYALTVTGAGGILDLAGNGAYDGAFLEPGNAHAEAYAAWVDLHASGLWGVDPAEMPAVGLGHTPNHRFGGPMAFAEGLLGLGPSLCLADLPADAARGLDRALDDGDAATGAVRLALLPDDWRPPVLNQSLRRDAIPFDQAAGVLACVALEGS